MFPTTIHSNYCTNPTWLTSAIANAALFNVTLYVSSLHMAGLKSLRESPETLYYKAQTIQCLNECLKNDKQALSDETIAAVLCLLFVVVSIRFRKDSDFVCSQDIVVRYWRWGRGRSSSSWSSTNDQAERRYSRLCNRWGISAHDVHVSKLSFHPIRTW